MATTHVARASKTRRASAPGASSSSMENSEFVAHSWNEVILPSQGGSPPSVDQYTSARDGNNSCSAGMMAMMDPSELLQLHRRCFSCCNIVLQQEAMVGGDERKLLSQQPKFTQHPLMKAITKSVSEQRYPDMGTFVTDFGKLVDTCVDEHDRQALQEAFSNHVARTGQAVSKRPNKATFQGFPHPILEEMMATAATLRKKLPPSGNVDVTVDVGRYFSKAYGLGLAAGARFCGDPSQEKEFYARRKKREAEYKAGTGGSEAQKRNKEKEKGNQLRKKKRKLQGVESNATDSPKAKRSLRATRRKPVVIEPVYFRRSDLVHSMSGRHTIADRSKRRFCSNCRHVQNQRIEMDDSENEGGGGRSTGIVKANKIACECGCEKTMKGQEWLKHNGGRASNRHPGYPWKYMRMCDTQENLKTHSDNCDTHDYLCDTCGSWGEPGRAITTCWECRTCVHATEECALRAPLVRADLSSGGVLITRQGDGTAVRQPVADPDSEAQLDTRAAGKTNTNAHREPGGGGSQSSQGSAANGAGGSEAGGRSRPCRRRSSGHGIPIGAAAASATEGESVGADTSNGSGISNEGSGGTEEGAGGVAAAPNEEVFTWVCAVCSGSGREHPPV